MRQDAMTARRSASATAEAVFTSAPPVARKLPELFAVRHWQPFDFQRAVWEAIGRGQSGLLHATTGTGKTYAAWLGALLAFAHPPSGPGRRRPR
ncbi:hypothetical protein AWV80_18445 [Cupriavidus sp. UYMU48A]|nr:hypothetical protein AWV80_18445 [Cupriavidus sp. UYMU48A]